MAVEIPLKVDWQYVVEYDYNERTDCSRGGCDSICRCSTISDARVVKVSDDRVVEAVIDQCELELRDRAKVERRARTIAAKAQAKATGVAYVASPAEGPVTLSLADRHAIERVCAMERFEEDSFEVLVRGGYYGEEVDRIELAPEMGARLRDRIAEVLGESDFDARLLRLLEWEYGYLPDGLADKTFWIETLSLDGVSLEEFRKLDETTVDMYTARLASAGAVDVPLGLVVRSDRDRLLDGYHRVTAARRAGLTSATFVVAE